MKDMKITLYDIFGYLIPGCVALVGIYLIAWRLILPVNQDWSNISMAGWVVVLGVAYVIGHFAQALSNVISQIVQKNPEQYVILDTFLVPPQVAHLAKRRAYHAIGISENDELGIKLLYDIMDHYLQQHGRTESRDIYVYREGFYRGLAVSFFLLALGALFRITGEQGNLSIFGANFTFTRAYTGFVGILSIIMAVFALVRYWKFTVYRIKNSLYSFLAICKVAE